MAQLSEIPASAYTLEMDTLGAIPVIPVFEGDQVSVSRNALTPRTRPRQLLPLPGSDFPVRLDTDAMRGFQSEVDLGKARAGGSSTDASAFWDLLDPPMRSRVVAAGFGDYAAGLRRTQPRFPPAMRYALMEWWNDCTHSFIFDSGEMTLTPSDYTAITGLGFDGVVAPVDSGTNLPHWELSLLGPYSVFLPAPGTKLRGTSPMRWSINFGPSGFVQDWLRMLDLQLLLIRGRRGTRRHSLSFSTLSPLSFCAPPRIRETLPCWPVYGI
ncbi:hypothetical protein JCGZ_03196 [Jatropha curcas]|uniref:Aminotransferase-like plant mobile domain-containing protein n=1 Tax=Jatropha curcas TaxID=180498 RepID=A0A067JDL9_JATCU|nr:hypothetical protein JCGZ_03196 [Jatropha curcas]